MKRVLIFCLGLLSVQLVAQEKPLDMKMDFEQFWSNSDSAVASYTDIELHQLFEGFQAILYLHMCAELKPSATKTEVVETLSKKHSCFKQF